VSHGHRRRAASSTRSPDATQIEGAVVNGIGMSLFRRLRTIAKRRADQSQSRRLHRRGNADVPSLEVHFVEHPDTS